MKKELIDQLLTEEVTEEDKLILSVLKKMPDEAFMRIIAIQEQIDEKSHNWATIQMVQLCRQYLSNDTELMRMIDEIEQSYQ